MGFDFDQGRQARDRRLRRSMLDALDASRGERFAGLKGRTLIDVLVGRGLEDDAHAMQLVRDLVNKGLVAERQLTIRRGERFGPDHVFLSITDLGSKLIRGQSDVDTDIDDERLPPGVE